MNYKEIMDILDNFDKRDLLELKYKSNEYELIIKSKAIFSEKKEENTFDKITEVKNNGIRKTKNIISDNTGIIKFNENIEKNYIVKKEEKIGVIEVMKMNIDIISNVEGRIKELLVANNDFVEYGTSLIELEEL